MVRKKKTGDRKDILAAVRKKLQEESLGGSKGFWKPKEGRSVIRIMPGVGDMEDFFWQDVGKHYLPGQKFSHVCPSFTIGEPCPICEAVQELYNEGTKEAEDLAGEMRVSKQYWMNIIVRGQEGKGPQIFTPGVTIFREISALVEDVDYGEIYDEDDGVDITIIRKGSGRETEYTVTPRRKASHIGAGGFDDKVDEWFDNALDLTPVMLTSDPAEDKANMPKDAVVFVKPYDRLQEEFEQLAIGADKEEEQLPFDDDDEDEEESDVQAALKRRRASSSRRRRR